MDRLSLHLLKQTLDNEIEKLESKITGKDSLSKHFKVIEVEHAVDGKVIKSKMIEELSGLYSISKAIGDALAEGEN
jgi:hypothetical protein